MKKYIITTIALILFFISHSFGQFIKKPAIELGFCYHFNNFNEDKYLAYKYHNFSNNELYGINFKLVFPTEIEYIDLIVGTLFEDVAHTYVNDSYTPGHLRAIDYKANGGGIYIGISPKLKGEYFGLTSEFAVGILSYKEYSIMTNNVIEPYYDEYIRKASSGLGAISSVGLYVQFGKIRINPNLQSIFTGGDQTSFLYYGFNLPISYQF